MKKQIIVSILIAVFFVVLVPGLSQAVVKIGLNYPKTGPYQVQGLDQLRAAQLAVEELNAQDGILGEKIVLVTRDSQSKPEVAKKNVSEMIDNEDVKMVFGGSSSAVAIASGKVCHNKNVPFFGTLTYSTATTGEEGLKTTFRECYNAWMAAEAMGEFLQSNYSSNNNKYLYITADYTWGHTTESSVREFTDTKDKSVHKGTKTPFPGASEKDFKKALNFAKMINPDVLVLVLFGNDMQTTIRLATSMGLKQKMQIIVPNLTLGMAEGAGAKVMEGVIGSLPWSWKIPFNYNYSRGKEFVNKFASRHDRYPSTSGASAYTILYEYKSAVERAGSFDTQAVTKSLEGHEYKLLKDKQYWRDFDHQSIQTVYLVQCKPAEEVMQDKFGLDCFEILSSIPGEKAARTYEEWSAVREEAGKPSELR
ncbi:branched-chain amino acid ABC transporter substrate-binding protein [candidate division MSBL1 archaeon SCGC-AAA385M11]|nr:branched-chain amino acid ABC transporter substrate-binding protein [candidate division MSBL1 archaeon SCGC-AAA385M11]